MWDLQRNGGNVTATTERVLSGRALEVVSPPTVHDGFVKRRLDSLCHQIRFLLLDEP